jgi:hypothetical protein
MKKRGLLTMSTKEIDKLKVIQDVLEKRIKQRHAAVLLKLSTRQVRRLCGRVRRQGAKGLLHGLRGQGSNHQLPPGRLEEALDIVRKQYTDFGPTFANEKIEEVHKIFLSTSLLRQGMIRIGLWSPRPQGPFHRAWRERRASVGELVQLDGSDHDWFEGRGPRCALLVFIDDATSKILLAAFIPVEDTQDLLASVKTYLLLHGRPVAFYVDRDSIYKVNRQASIEEELRDTQPLTQFTRAMGELGIEMIFALSPQAKGRVERGFHTHQDRLVKELRLAGISAIPEANEFLRRVYIPGHNARCAVMPRSRVDVHRPLLKRHRLDEILSFRRERVVANDFTLRFENRFLQILPDQLVVVRPKDAVLLETRLDGSTHIRFKGVYLAFRALPQRPVRPERHPRMTRPARPRPGTLAYARQVKILL